MTTSSVIEFKPVDQGSAVAALNVLLCCEITAAKTYRQALAQFSGVARGELYMCLVSHAHRVQKIMNRILGLGGDPEHNGGTWGPFATLVDGGASRWGRRAALCVLSAGETNCLIEYRKQRHNLDHQSQDMLTSELLAEQKKTYEAISKLSQDCQQLMLPMPLSSHRKSS